MQKLVWQNANGVELDLTSGNYGITEWEGFSNASLNIQQQQVPFQDGGVFLDALIEQRELSVTLAMQDNNNLELRYQLRRELISALNPKLGEGYLVYTNDYISKRIKCVPQIPLFETHNSDTVGTPKASLSWTACSPYWEDLEETEVEIGAEPTEVVNDGECEIGFEADILASNIDDFILQNITTEQKIEIEDNIGTKIELDTKVGEKKLTAQATNLEELTFNYNIRPAQGLVWVEELGLYIGNIRDENSIAYIGTSPDGETWTQRYQANPQVILWNKYQNKVYALADGYFLSSTDGVTWTVVSSTMPACTCGCVNLYTGEMFFFAETSAVAFRTFDGLTKTSIPTIIANTCCYNPKTNTVYAFKSTQDSWICKNSGNFERVPITEETYGISYSATGDNGNVIVGASSLVGGGYIFVCNSDLQLLPTTFSLPQGVNAFLFADLGFASGMYIVSCLVPFTNNTFILTSKDGQKWESDCFDMLNWYAQKIIEGKDEYACLIEYTFMYITKFGEENKISKLTPDSDMTLKLTQGANYLFYSASLNEVGTTEGVSVKLKYRQKYIGV